MAAVGITRVISHISVETGNAAARGGQIGVFHARERAPGDGKDRAAFAPIASEADAIRKIAERLALIQGISAAQPARHAHAVVGGQQQGVHVLLLRRLAAPQIF